MNTAVLEQLGGVAFLPYQPPDPSSMVPQQQGLEGVELEKASATLELTVKGDRLTGLLGVIPGDPGGERDVLVRIHKRVIQKLELGSGRADLLRFEELASVQYTF